MADPLQLSRIFEVYGNKQYIIPVYQRGYAWEKKHVEEFWSDLHDAKKEGKSNTHFYGNIYTTNEPKDLSKIVVVDGQQRLITSALLLICARDIFQESEDPEAGKYRERMQNRLYASDDGVNTNMEKPLLTLSTANLKFFKNILNETGPNKLKKLKESAESKRNTSNKNLLTAYTTLFKKLQEVADKSGIREIIVMVHTMLLQFTIQVYHMDDPDKIYRLFHLLNARGLPLEHPDLVKNYLFGLLSGSDAIEDYDNRWDDMRSRITGKSDASATQEQFFHHYLTAVGRYKLGDDKPERIAGRDVYRYFKKIIEDIPDESTDKSQRVKNLIDDLCSWSEKFHDLRKPESFHKEDAIQNYLKKIRATKAVFLYPALLAGYKTYWENNDKSSFSKLVQMCFIYHIRVKAVGTSIATSEFERSLNKLTDDIHDHKPIVDIINDLMNDPQHYPDDDKFRANMKDYTVADSGLATSLLEEIESVRSQKPSLSSVSLEHIMPRSYQKWSENESRTPTNKMTKHEMEEFHNRYKNKLGNQTLLSNIGNSIAAAKPFKEKLEIYKHSENQAYEITKDLCNLEKWGKEEIDKRDEEFHDILVKRINLRRLL